METISRLVIHQNRDRFGASIPVFGSDEALDVYLQKVLKEYDDAQGRPPVDILDIHSGIVSERYIFSKDSESVGPTGYEECIVLDCVKAARSSYALCALDGLVDERKSPSPEHPVLVSVWIQMKYREIFEEDKREEVIAYPESWGVNHQASCGEYSSISTTPSQNHSHSLSLDPPRYSSPSKICPECGVSLLSAKTIISPPGYCEYSGNLICGECFEPRSQIIPWRLISSSDTIRGRVSRRSAESIQENFYVSNIHYSDISARQSREKSGRISHIHSLRVRLLTLRPVIASCGTVSRVVSPVLDSLPSHIRVESTPEEILLYSLADLWDIINPPGVCSVICRVLSQVVGVIEAHTDCMHCAQNFCRTCIMCEKSVRTTSTEWTICDVCTSSFHRKCLRYSTDGCPVCIGVRIH